MNKYELLVLIAQCLRQAKESLKFRVDASVVTHDTHILFTVKKETGKIKAYRIEVKEI